ELGVKLLLRDSRGVSLTPEGVKVLEHAEQMLDTLQVLKQSIQAPSSKVGLATANTSSGDSNCAVSPAGNGGLPSLIAISTPSARNDA
ncbi:hypothetical protein SB756_31340, partial [Pseudomonas sp. SIMBA_068]